jgi:hypothetical protein
MTGATSTPTGTLGVGERTHDLQGVSRAMRRAAPGVVLGRGRRAPMLTSTAASWLFAISASRSRSRSNDAPW